MKFHLEKLDYKLYQDMLPLLKLAMEEVYLPKENLTLANSMKLDTIENSEVNYRYYKEREQLGLLNICTMRKDGELVAHHSTVLQYHPQSQNLLTATTQNVFIKKEFRGLYTRDFFKFTEDILRSRGVKHLIMAVNPQLSTDKKLEALGFTLDEVVYTKGL